jgi:copper(I)-binding protein
MPTPHLLHNKLANQFSLVKSLKVNPKLTDLPRPNAHPISSRGLSQPFAEARGHWRSANGNLMFLLFLALLVTIPSLSLADNQLSVQIQRPWMRAVPAAMDMTAVYMILVNTGSTAAQLVGGSTSIADSVEPMITTKEGEGLKQIVGMKAVDFLEIPAHGTLVLEANGNHLMVMGLKEHPKEGTQVDFTVKLEPGDRQVRLKIPVSKTPVK